MILLVIAISCFSLLFAVYLARYVLQHEMGTDKMQEISNAIKEGAEAFLSRQNRTIILLGRCCSPLIFASLRICPDAESGGSCAARRWLFGRRFLCLGCFVFSYCGLYRHVGFDPRQHSDRGRGALQS